MKKKFVIVCGLMLALTGCGSKAEVSKEVEVHTEVVGETVSEIVELGTDVIFDAENESPISVGEAIADVTDEAATTVILEISDEELGLKKDEVTGELVVDTAHSEWYAKDKQNDYTITIEGDTYDFPCSLQEFIDNGWTVKDGFDNDIIEPSRTGWLQMERDGKVIEPEVRNFWDVNRNKFDLDVFKIRLCSYGWSEPNEQMNASLGCGIALGDTIDNLTEELFKYSGSVYKTQTDYSTGTTDYWQFSDADLDAGAISVEVSAGRVTQIHIECNCKGVRFTGQVE